jgi:hypothetical protein
MLEDIDPGMVALFGSQDRTLVLSALANASGPLSGYRVAKLFGGQKIKVNAELVRLAKAGIVTRRRAPSGKLGWTLEDPDLRRLLRKRARICFAPDWDRRRPASGKRSTVSSPRSRPRSPIPRSTASSIALRTGSPRRLL